MDNLEEVVHEPLATPELSDEQSNRIHLVIVPSFGQFDLEEMTGDELSKLVEAADGKMAVKVRNAIYRYLPTAQPGDHVWLGHMQPMVFCKRQDEVSPLMVPKPLGVHKGDDQ